MLLNYAWGGRNKGKINQGRSDRKCHSQIIKSICFSLCASLCHSHQLKHTILLEPTTTSCPFNLSANFNKTTNTMCSANYFQVHFEQQTKVPWLPTETRYSNPLALSSLRCIQRVGGTKAHGYFERRCLFDNEVKDEMKHEAG